MKRRIQYLTVAFVAICTCAFTLSNYREVPGSFLIPGDLILKERADHAQTPSAGYGQLWVKSDTPNVLMFTSDAGTDVELGAAGGGAVDSVNGQTGVVALDADDIDDAATTNRFVTAGDQTNLANLSGTNTGDATLSGTPDYITRSGQVFTLGLIDLTADVTGALPIANGGTGATSLAAANIAVTTGHLGQFAATPSSQLLGVLSDETGTGLAVFATSPTLTTPNLGTPSAATLTNATGLPIATGLATGSSADLAGRVTDETGTGAFVLASSPTLTTPALGTPSALVLTNATGLPVAGGGTGQSTLGDAGVVIGNGTSGVNVTTAGTAGQVLTSGGAGVDPTFQDPAVTESSTDTLSNKRITKRVGTTTSSATPTINTDNYDLYIITAQAADITSMTTNLSGTPVVGDTLDIWITGTAARAITWGASFGSGVATLPTTTVTTTRLYTRFIYDGSIWRCMATGSNP